MRRWLLSASFLIPLTLSAPAFADGDCPPGSWFCEDVEVPKPNLDDADDQADDAGTQAQGDAQVAPKKKKKKKKAAQSDADAAGQAVVVQGQEGGETVIIVRQQPGQRVVVVGPDGQPAAEPPPEPPPAVPRTNKKKRWRERFGLNLRLEAAAFAGRNDNGAGLGGIGASFRWRPSPYFALDVGTDLMGGVDYNGDDRVELSGALSGIVYFNPGDVVQIYGIGGIFASHAEVDDGLGYCDGYYCGYGYGYSNSTGRDYVGADAGLGVEFRLSRHFGLSIDGLALIRQKVDDSPPEFVDAATGETTDTSAAGLFRAGLNFWW